MSKGPIKLKIEVLGEKDFPPIATFHVQYNPPDYTITAGVQIAEVGIPGLESPILQFVRGSGEQISMKLFFDTTEDGRDVRLESEKFYRLVKINRDLHAPPRCRLSWGMALGAQGGLGAPLGKKYIAVVTNISQRFTLFKADGTPLRTEMDVTFKEFRTLAQQIAELKAQSPDHTKIRKVKSGDTLSSIAYEVYGDSRKWRDIADANKAKVIDPRMPAAGLDLLVRPFDLSGLSGK